MRNSLSMFIQKQHDDLMPDTNEKKKKDFLSCTLPNISDVLMFSKYSLAAEVQELS